MKTTIRSTFAVLKRKQKSADYKHYMSTLRLALGAGCSVLFAWVCFRRKGSCDVRADKEYFGCFKVKIEKLRLKRKHSYRSTEVFFSIQFCRGNSNALLPQASWSIPGRCLRPLKACCPRHTWPVGWGRGFRRATSGYTQP